VIYLFPTSKTISNHLSYKNKFHQIPSFNLAEDSVIDSDLPRAIIKDVMVLSWAKTKTPWLYPKPKIWWRGTSRLGE